MTHGLWSRGRAPGAICQVLSKEPASALWGGVEERMISDLWGDCPREGALITAINLSYLDKKTRTPCKFLLYLKLIKNRSTALFR